MNNQLLSKSQAREFLELDNKVFENYFKFAEEFQPLSRPSGYGAFKFDKSQLEEWKNSYNWRTVEINKEDYGLCLDFALAMHFRGYVVSDWGTSRQREFGQKVTNWVKGQLGEVAVKKFLKSEFNKNVILDFELHDDIVPQDIIGIYENGTERIPKIGIGIKSSKPKNAYLILGENEIERTERRSEIYIFCRPDIPDDHLLRIGRNEVLQIVSDKPHFEKYKNILPDFENIPCEIAGWCAVEDLDEVTSIPGQEFDGKRYVRKSGKLRRSREDWQKLVDLL